MRHRPSTVIGLIAAALSAPARPAPVRVELPRSGVVRLSARPAPWKIEVAIRTGELAAGRTHTDLLTGAEFRSVVLAITICVDGESVFVPREAYSRMFDPHRAALAWRGKEAVLSLEGADAAYSWHDELHFDRRGVTRKTSRDEIGDILEVTYRLHLAPLDGEERGRVPCPEAQRG